MEFDTERGFDAHLYINSAYCAYLRLTQYQSQELDWNQIPFSPIKLYSQTDNTFYLFIMNHIRDLPWIHLFSLSLSLRFLLFSRSERECVKSKRTKCRYSGKCMFYVKSAESMKIHRRELERLRRSTLVTQSIYKWQSDTKSRCRGKKEPSILQITSHSTCAYTFNWNSTFECVALCKCFLSRASAIDLWLVVSECDFVNDLWFPVFTSLSSVCRFCCCLQQGNQIGGLDLCKYIDTITKWHIDNNSTLYSSLFLSLSWFFFCFVLFFGCVNDHVD